MTKDSSTHRKKWRFASCERDDTKNIPDSDMQNEENTNSTAEEKKKLQLKLSIQSILFLTTVFESVSLGQFWYTHSLRPRHLWKENLKKKL